MQINWENWIYSGDDDRYIPLRQAVHTVLLAIANCSSLKDQMMLKGGILMALCYKSSRYTSDIDLSQTSKYQEGDKQKLLDELAAALVDSVQELNYGLDCRIQSSKLKPPSHKNPTFPVLEVKVAYAYLGDKSHAKLDQGICSTVLELDLSFNEQTKFAEALEIAEGQSLLRYSLIDLMAEKFRALLQQVERDRFRGQDLYDLLYLLRNVGEQIENVKTDILNALLESAKSKNLKISNASLDDEQIRTNTQRDYDLLIDSVEEGALEKFETAYESVKSFYKSLPWEEKK